MNKNQWNNVVDLLTSDIENDFLLGIEILKAKKVKPSKLKWCKIGRNSTTFVGRFTNFVDGYPTKRWMAYSRVINEVEYLNPNYQFSLYFLDNYCKNAINYEEIHKKTK